VSRLNYELYTEIAMASIYIQNPYKRVEFEVFKQLKTFVLRKFAVEWCKENNIRPARIVKLSTRFQESYALDMGRNTFLMDDV